MNKLFEETQRFRQKWVWAALIGAGIASVYFPVSTARYIEAAAVSAVFLTVYAIFYLFRLETRVDSSGVHYRFYPFQIAERTIDFDEIEEMEVGEYAPLREFGGWGIRWRPGRIAFTVSGKKCVRLDVGDGRQIVLGTRRPEEMEKEVEKHL